MKILYFHQYFTTPKGAAGTRSYEFAKSLLTAGHEVHIVCGSFVAGETGITNDFVKNKRTGVVDGIQVTEFDLHYSNNDGFISRTRKFLSYALKSVWIALRSDYDVIFATSTPLTASLPGIVARWVRRKKFVFEVRDLWPELPREMGVLKNPVVLWALGALEWASYNSASACVGLSPGIVAGIKKRAPKKDVVMIPNGSDLSKFETASAGTVEIAGVVDTDFVCMFTGAHGIANGLNSVLDCAAYLLENGTRDIKFVFIGGGMEKQQLQTRAQSEELENCIFMPPVPKDELAKYLKRANVALMILKDVPAFYYGTSPNKFFDYLSAGKPIVTNYQGWLADMITEYQLGAAVQSGSASEFGDALVQLSLDPTKLSEMGQNSLNLAKSEFDREALSSQFVQFIERHAV